MKKKKVRWTKPKLIVLGRGKPEENVLEICKGFDVGFGGPVSNRCWGHPIQGECNAPGTS